MSDTPPFKAPIGTHDVLGAESARWEGLIATFANFAHRYGFHLAITPMFEDVGVFKRGIGEESDVARKEMYVFQDRGERTYALRPEGTAPIVRAFIQHNPTTPFKAWYFTPAFRYERPQAGRYRQHHQLGVEVLGTEDPMLDVEVVSLAQRFFEGIGLHRFRLLINSMGDAQCRADYVVLLRDFLAHHADELCDEHAKVWSENPLRVLDCKNERCIAVTNEAPMLIDHLCDACRVHFDAVRGGLRALGIDATLEPRLVRGFDYYSRTTFEFISDALDGAQNAIGGGGRYDGLVEQLGGKPSSGIGFGSGVERLLLTLDAEGIKDDAGLRRDLDIFLVDTVGTDAPVVLLDRLRHEGYSVDRSYDQRSMKAQMKLADKSGARLALLLGPQELAAGEVTMRDLRSGDFGATQDRVAQVDLLAVLAQRLKVT
jgi:histidyl-tRNA synthetase